VAAQQAPEDEQKSFSIGDSVMVKERTMRGSNKEGGLGRIVGFNARDGTYGVKYLLRTGGEDGVAPRYITPVDAGGASPDGRRSTRSRTEAKEAYDPSKEAAKPQFTTGKSEKKDKKEKAASPTARPPPAAAVVEQAAAASAADPADVDPDDICCMTCGKSNEDELLVLCDGCENGRHTFCCDPPLDRVPEGDWYCGACQGPPIDLSGPLDLTLVKRKVLARAYAQDGTEQQTEVGLSKPKMFPDLSKLEADVAAMCEPILASQPPSTANGSHYKEAQKLLEMAKSAVQTLRQRQDEERAYMGKLSRYSRRLERNKLPAMQGEWRRKPYALRDYTPIEEYVPVEGLTEEEGKDVLSQLDTELEGLLSYTYSYEEKTSDADRQRQQASLREAGVSEDQVVEAEVQAVLEDLVERVAWVNCSQDPSVRDRALQIGKHLEEIPVWGMDSYSRGNIEMALEDMPTESGLEPLTKSERSTWIERTLAPAINRQGVNGYDIKLALQDLVNCATTAQSRKMPQVVLESVDDLGQEHFRLHPKGTGVVCRVPGGIAAQQFVTEYLGELVPPWRWFEKQEAVEAAQKHFGQKPTLPDFYNMLMERHRDDSRGYAVLYIDAAERNNFASSLSHSCEPNCRTTVAAIGKKYSVCLYTIRHIEPGEELTIDYSAATENEKEFRSAVCLCGSRACRGSFLYFTGANESQQVLQRDHTIVDRFAQLVLACSNTPVMIPTQEIMNRHGLRKLCVGAAPEWLNKFVGLALKFVDTERAALPMELLRAPEVENQKHSYKTADAESRQMLEQRVQNLAITLSRLRYFLDHQFRKISDAKLGYNGQLDAIPAMRKPIESCDSFNTQIQFGSLGSAAPIVKGQALVKAEVSKVKKPNGYQDGAPALKAAKPRKKGKPDGPQSWPWKEDELLMLATLVRRDGPTKWAAKAAEMQTHRNASSVGSAWKRYGEKYKDSADVPVPNPDVTAAADREKAAAEQAYAAKVVFLKQQAEKQSVETASEPTAYGSNISNGNDAASIDVTFTGKGPMGIRWQNETTEQGDRLHVTEIAPTCAQKEHLQLGLVLTAIAGCNVLDRGFEEVIEVLQRAPRPLTLTFKTETSTAKAETTAPASEVENISTAAPASEVENTSTASPASEVENTSTAALGSASENATSSTNPEQSAAGEVPCAGPATSSEKLSTTIVANPYADMIENPESLEPQLPSGPITADDHQNDMRTEKTPPADALAVDQESAAVSAISTQAAQAATAAETDAPTTAPPTATAVDAPAASELSGPDNGETPAAVPEIGWTGRARTKVQTYVPEKSPVVKAKKIEEENKVAATAITAKRGCAYNAEEDETAKTIADKLKVDVGDLVLLNKQRYPALTRTRKLRHGTVLLIPDTEGALDGNRVVGDVAARQPPKVITKVSELPAPLHVLNDDETIRCMWTGKKSVVRRLVEYAHLSVRAHAAAKSMKERLNKKDAKEALGICEEMKRLYGRAQVRTMPELDEAMREMRQLVRKLPSSSSYGQHRAAADLLTHYIHTSIFFVLQPYITFSSEPVRIRARDIDGVLLSRERLIAAESKSDGAKKPRKEAQSIGKPWTEEEQRKLEVLVKEHGAGNWPERARQLGTGRNASSVNSQWRRILSLRDKAQGEQSGTFEAAKAAATSGNGTEPVSADTAAGAADMKTEPCTSASDLDQDRPTVAATEQVSCAAMKSETDAVSAATAAKEAAAATAVTAAEAAAAAAAEAAAAVAKAAAAAAAANQTEAAAANATAAVAAAAAAKPKSRKRTKRKAGEPIGGPTDDAGGEGKGIEAPVVDPVTGDIDQKRVVYQHGKRYSSNFILEQMIGWFSQEKVDNKMPTTRSICGSVFVPDISSCYVRTQSAKDKGLRPYNHVENKQIVAYLNEPLEAITRAEAAGAEGAQDGGGKDAAAAAPMAVDGDAAGAVADGAAQPKPEPAAATAAASAATTHLGSHTAKWPSSVIDQFHLDAVSPHETEAGAWLFGGPCLDYAVTQDRAALRNLVREMRGYKTRAGGTSDNGEEEDANVKWVQCENPECLKWRKLPSWLRDEELGDKFTCDQNKWVPHQASCDAPEDDFSEEVTVTWSLGDLAGTLQEGDGVDAYCSKHSW
jgi:hypothetical protein